MTTATHPSPLNLPAGTHALCTCGLSQNGAFCDGSHLQLSVHTPDPAPSVEVLGLIPQL